MKAITERQKEALKEGGKFIMAIGEQGLNVLSVRIAFRSILASKGFLPEEIDCAEINLLP